MSESGPTIEDLAVWAHTFAIGALGKQLGPLHIVSSFRRKKELEEKILNNYLNQQKPGFYFANPLSAYLTKQDSGTRPATWDVIRDELTRIAIRKQLSC